MLQPFLLELDGIAAGRVLDSQGGAQFSEVVTSSTMLIQHIKIRPSGFGNIVLACGPGMSRLFYNWVGSAFLKQNAPKNGAVIALDLHSKPKGRLEFYNTWVTSLALPELNKSVNKQATLIISLKPGKTSINKSIRAQSLGSYTSPLSKIWHTCDFQIKIAGLEADCSHVTRILPLTMGERIVSDFVGEEREPVLEPSKEELSDVTLEIPKSNADGFQKWLKDTATEKDGSLDLLAPKSVSPYFTVQLAGLGVRKITSKGASLQVSMYCNSMSFSAGTAAIA